jgi:hypothetical protein
MPASRQTDKTSTAFLEVAAAWVLAGVALAAVTLLPADDAGGPIYSPAAANLTAHLHPIHATPGCDDDAAEAYSSHARAEEASIRSAKARAIIPSTASGDSDESDEC